MKLAEFANALPIGNIEYICLQKQIKVEDEVTLKARDDIQFIGAELNDFTDTAAVIENLDLIISTCTSVPHLSAAMGKRTIILLSHVADWRWGSTGISSNFYRNTALIRQDDSCSWDSTLEIVLKFIIKMI
jgi:ADP-heptose:LPS heptosyltransferase